MVELKSGEPPHGAELEIGRILLVELERMDPGFIERCVKRAARDAEILAALPDGVSPVEPNRRERVMYAHRYFISLRWATRLGVSKGRRRK